MRFLELAVLVFVLLWFANPYLNLASAYPRSWMRAVRCLHHAETRRPWSRGWHLTKDWLGRPSVNHGGLQINVGTWRSYVPRGWPDDPAAASRSEQIVVAHRIWLASGDSFRQWSTAQACGV